MCVCDVHVLMCVGACMYMQVSLRVCMNECGCHYLPQMLSVLLTQALSVYEPKHKPSASLACQLV